MTHQTNLNVKQVHFGLRPQPDPLQVCLTIYYEYTTVQGFRLKGSIDRIAPLATSIKQIHQFVKEHLEAMNKETKEIPNPERAVNPLAGG